MAATAVTLAAGCSGSRLPLQHRSGELLLQDAHDLSSQRKCQSALRVLNQLPPDSRERPDVWSLTGECRYRTGDFTGAVAAFDAALRADPTLHRARYARWAAMLAGGVKKSVILDEVELLSSVYPNDSDFRLAEYDTYELLRLTDPQRRLMVQLAEHPGSDHRLDDEIARRLLELMIASDDVAVQRQLAEIFLRRFAPRRGEGLAARYLIRADRTMFSDPAMDVVTYLGSVPRNRHLDQAVASILINEGRHLELAEELLGRSLIHWEQSASMERGWYRGEVAWRTLREWERAEVLFQRGLLHEKQRRFDEAMALFRDALPAHPQRWQVYAGLFRVTVSSDPETARKYLIQSLEYGNPDASLEVKLSRSMDQSSNPRRELTARRGIAEFEDVTTDAGLDEVRSAAVAWGDFDNDGFEDLLVSGPRLFRNRRGRSFEESTVLPKTESGNIARSGYFGDIDNDGWLDVLLLTRDGIRVLINHHGRRFDDRTLDFFSRAPDVFSGRAEAAAFGDIENDGWLDVYTTNYQAGPDRGLCRHDQLFGNVRGSRLVDVSTTSGVRIEEPACGRGVLWTDLDGDGFLDIAVANYRLHPNHLFRNRGNAQFEELGESWGVRGNNVDGAFGQTIAMASGDVNGDGWTDLYVSNLAHPRYLDYSDLSEMLLNRMPQVAGLRPKAERGGVEFDETSSVPVLADFDNDGDLDLYVTSVYRGRHSHLYQNAGNARFHNVSWLSAARIENGWGNGVADFDNDGDLDLAVGSDDGLRILRNRGTGNHWLQVRIRSDSCNHFGVGAVVKVRQGPVMQIQEIQAGRGTGAQDSLTAHFGLGPDSAPVDIEVHELCGKRVVRTGVSPNQRVTFGAGISAPASSVSSARRRGVSVYSLPRLRNVSAVQARAAI